MAESAVWQRALTAACVWLAEPLVAAQRCAWGFTHETWLLGTPSRSVILQLPHPSTDVGAMITSASYVPGLFARQGLRVPRLLHAAHDHDPPFLLREYIAGQPGVQWLGDPADARRLAQAMGRVLRRLASLPAAEAALPRVWAAPQTLAEQARRWLRECAPFLNSQVVGSLQLAIELLAGQEETAAVVAHGDFCPVNVIVNGDDVAGLIDIEAARLAGPLFDAAWWG
ncbi:MAG TPA: phosphotransferase, partial [Roseiflexaceae bacterium]|nr:phosphotransferase [Roseiflexaceae bacterium]